MKESLDKLVNKNKQRGKFKFIDGKKMRKNRKKGVYYEVIEPPDPFLNSFIDRINFMCQMKREFGQKITPVASKESTDSDDSNESFPTIKSENFLAETISSDSVSKSSVHIAQKHPPKIWLQTAYIIVNIAQNASRLDKECLEKVTQIILFLAMFSTKDQNLVTIEDQS